MARGGGGAEVRRLWVQRRAWQLGRDDAAGVMRSFMFIRGGRLETGGQNLTLGLVVRETFFA